MKARFHNREGYTLVQDGGTGWPRTPLYHFRLDDLRPLTWQDDVGTLWQPNRSFLTDMGSVPRVIQVIPSLGKDAYLLPYLMHDSAYRHHASWMSLDRGSNYRECRLSRAQADDMLYQMIRSDGGLAITAAAVWSGVRLGGWASW